MKNITLVGMTLIAGGLAACDPTNTKASTGVVDQTYIEFNGQYTVGGDCAALSETFSITETSVRFAQTQCNIKSRLNVSSSSSEYSLSNCMTGKLSTPDQTITILEVEDSQLNVTGWGESNLTLNLCR